jgi:hypothetical protein
MEVRVTGRSWAEEALCPKPKSTFPTGSPIKKEFVKNFDLRYILPYGKELGNHMDSPYL